MPRRATGTVIAPKGKQRSWAIRFTAYGRRHFVSLGRPEDGWDRQRAETELRHVLADVERGIWRLHEPEQLVSPKEEPTFHEFASQWLESNKLGWAARTAADYQWALSYSQILEVAEEYDYVGRNPARSKRRRLKVPRVKRSWVEPEQVPSLLEGSSSYMRPVVATLTGAGLRVSEAVGLDWADVNLATGTLRVGKAKTDAGSYREVDLPGGLVDELTEWKMRSAGESAKWKAQNLGRDDPVFLSTHAGRIRRQSAANVARRLKTAIKGANRRLERLGVEPISERVTPHSLRRTFASLRAAAGDDPVYIAEQLGHTDPRFTLQVYTKAVKRRAKLSGEYLAEYERALAWAALPTTERAEKGRMPLPGGDQRRARLDEQAADLA